MVRAFRWLTLIKSVLMHFDSILIGMGPSFGSAAVDGYYVRVFIESGLIGLVAFFAFLRSLTKSRSDQSGAFREFVIVLIVTASFIDIFASYKTMLFLWLWNGMNEFDRTNRVRLRLTPSFAAGAKTYRKSELKVSLSSHTGNSQHGVKVGIQIRADHGSKTGGDIALAKAFGERLTSSGFQVELLSTAEAVLRLRPRLLIAFNLDQMLELFDICAAAKRCGAEVAVYALHHPSKGVRAYLKSGLAGARAWVAGFVGNNPAKYFYTMALLRGFRRMNPLAIKYFFLGHQRLIRDLAPMIDYLLVSGPSELAELQAEFPDLCNATIRIVPHPLTLPDVAVPNENPFESDKWQRHFFVGGRIESRKNQNSVLRVAGEVPDAEFIFAGQPNETDPKYCAEFHRLLAITPNCRWVGQLNMAALMQHLAYADAVVSPSWFEVMSLINLYAHALETPIISAKHTYDLDILHDGVTRYDPEAKGALLNALQAAAVRNQCSTTTPPRRLQQFSASTWAGFDEFTRYIGERLGEVQ
jgi:hypothetical protein